MAQIYIANPTLQHRELHYRLPNVPSTRVLRIAPGRQEMLPDRDLDGDALKAVIAQLERAGGVPEDDPTAIRSRFSLIYRVASRPIQAEAIEQASERDIDVRQDLAGDQMEKAGLAAFSAAEKVGASETTIEIIERDDRREQVKDGVLAEFTVSKKRGGSKRTERKR